MGKSVYKGTSFFFQEKRLYQNCIQKYHIDPFSRFGQKKVEPSSQYEKICLNRLDLSRLNTSNNSVYFSVIYMNYIWMFKHVVQNMSLQQKKCCTEDIFFKIFEDWMDLATNLYGNNNKHEKLLEKKSHHFLLHLLSLRTKKHRRSKCCTGQVSPKHPT